MAKRVSDFHLEQYLLGESPAWVREAIAEDPEAQRRIDALREDNAAFFEKYPPEDLVAAIEERADRDGATEEQAGETLAEFLRRLLGAVTLRPAVALGAVATVAVLIALPLFLTADRDIPVEGSGGEYVRLKGLEPSLSVYHRDAQGEVVELESGATVEAGDTLQIAYNSAGAAHGVIFSVDGRGAVTLHFPASPFESDRLEGGGENALPYAYILDDSPGFEKFYFVVAEVSLDVAEIITALESYVADAGAGSLDAAAVGRIVTEATRLAPEDIGVEAFGLRK